MRRLMAIVACFVGLTGTVLATDLDSIHWKNRTAWDCVHNIAVKPFEVTGEFRGPQTEQYYMDYLIRRLAAGLAGRSQVNTLAKMGTNGSPEPDVIIDGDFTELSTGSRAARFWVGFGAGTGKVGVRMVGRLPNGEVVFELEHARVAPFSLSGDANLGNIDAVAADVTDELVKHRSPCDPSKLPATPVAQNGTRQPPSDSSARSLDISIDANVPQAEVYVDDALVGNTPLAGLRLSEGPHRIDVRKRGYRDWSRTLTVLAGVTTKLVAELEEQK